MTDCPWDARVLTRMNQLENDHEQATKIRLSTQNEKLRWRSLGEHEPVLPGKNYRLQVFVGQHVIHREIFQLQDMQHPVISPPVDAPAPIEPEPAPVVVDPPAPSIDPLQVMSQRITADNERIQELHRVILELVQSVSTHAAGATGPLVKLIDQLTGNVTENNRTLTENVHRRLKELDQRETVVIEAEVEAEERLADADAKQTQAAQESAVLSGIMQHLGPELLGQLTGLRGGEN